MRVNVKRFASIMLILAMSGSMLAGCGKEKKNETKEASTQTTDDKIGGEITVAFMSAPENFDPDHPQSDWVVTADRKSVV